MPNPNRVFSLVLMYIAGGALLLLVATGCANIIGRALGFPLKGTYELMGYFGALAGSLALGGTQIGKGHILIGFLCKYLPKSLDRFLERLVLLAAAALFGLISLQCALLGISLWQSGQVSETLHLNYAPFPLAVALGTAYLTLILAQQALARGEKKPCRR
jgi:TRAP-type C4-dicarboxylate transport system permease small subunit